MTDHPVKITFAQMRNTGVRGILVYCCDYKCNHSVAISGVAWPDDVRLSDIEPRFVCTACGERGDDVRPDFKLEGKAGCNDGLSIGWPRPHVVLRISTIRSSPMENMLHL